MSVSAGRAMVARRLLGFAGLPLLSFLAPFLLLPLIARVGGVEGWAAVAVGQAIGGLGGVVAGLGWALIGPTAVARADDAGRQVLYAESMASRLLALLVVIPVCAGTAWLLSTPSQHWTAVSMAVAVAVGALSPSWFSIGIGRPSVIAVYEIVPRLSATAVAALLVVLLGAVWIYPVLLIASTLASTAVYGRRIAGTTSRDVLAVHAPRALWSTRSASVTVAVAGAYSSTPVLVAGVVASTTDLATFGSADRVYRLGLVAVQVLTNALQGWVSEPTESDRAWISRRMRFALVAHTGVGAAGALGLALLGPVATAVLFGRAVAAEQAISAAFGIAYLAVAMNSAMGRLILIPRGRSREVLTSTTVGAVLGLLAMVLLGATLGSPGVALGFMLSEVAVTAVQAGFILRDRRATPPQLSGSGPTSDS